MLPVLAAVVSLGLTAGSPPARGQCGGTDLPPPSDPNGADGFGWSVDVSGSLAVVGAWGDDDNGVRSGAASVYRFDGSDWNFEAKLTPPGGSAPYGRSGGSVAISGNRLVMGVEYYGIYPGEKPVYFFGYDESTSSWEQEAAFTFPGEGWGLFADSVAISDCTVVVGAPVANNFYGAAYVYRFDGESWFREGTLTSPGSHDGDFGRAVGISGDVAVIGAPYAGGGEHHPGRAYIYERNDNGTPNDPGDDFWPDEPSETLPLTTIDEDNRFGDAVGISGDTIVIGDGDTTADVAAYVYRYYGGAWNLEDQLVPTGWGSAWTEEWLAVDGDIIVIRGLGVHVFRRDDNGTPNEPGDDFWTEDCEIVRDSGPYRHSTWSASVGVSGENIVFGYAYVVDSSVSPGWANTFVGPNPCVGDIDCDCDTDREDLGILLAAWCSHEGDPNWNEDADLDGDGHVGQGDLGILLLDWGCGT